MKLSEPTSTRTNPLPPHSRARAVRYQINTTPEKMHASATSNAVRVFPDDLASQSKDRGQLAPGYQSVLISWLESSAFAFSGVRRRWQSPCAPGNLLCACFSDWHMPGHAVLLLIKSISSHPTADPPLRGSAKRTVILGAPTTWSSSRGTALPLN